MEKLTIKPENKTNDKMQHISQSLILLKHILRVLRKYWELDKFFKGKMGNQHKYAVHKGRDIQLQIKGDKAPHSH